MSALLGDWVDVCPWRSRLVLLVLVKGGEVSQASSLSDKRQLLDTRGGTLVAVWPGQWSSTARIITAADRRIVRAVLA